MKRQQSEPILMLRLAVGFLGERAQCGWWSTAFYEKSSRSFLEPVFVQTTHLAQYHGVVEAARSLHDEHLSVGTYHLFRLPEEVEQDLHATMRSSVGERLAGEGPSSREAAMEALKRMAAARSDFDVGPIAVGSIKDLDGSHTVKAIAAAYLSAFSRGAKIYPYLLG